MVDGATGEMGEDSEMEDGGERGMVCFGGRGGSHGNVLLCTWNDGNDRIEYHPNIIGWSDPNARSAGQQVG